MDETTSAFIVEQLGRMDTKLDHLVSTTSAHGPQIVAAQERLDRLEPKVEELQRHRWKLAGASALVGATVTVAAAAAAITALFL